MVGEAERHGRDVVAEHKAGLRERFGEHEHLQRRGRDGESLAAQIRDLLDNALSTDEADAAARDHFDDLGSDELRIVGEGDDRGVRRKQAEVEVALLEGLLDLRRARDRRDLDRVVRRFRLRRRGRIHRAAQRHRRRPRGRGSGAG